MTDTNSLKTLLDNSDGISDTAMEAYAETKVPKATPFMVSIGEKTIEEDPHADKREQWKKFVGAYKDDYLTHLRAGFNNLLVMLSEMSSDQQDPDRMA